MPARTNLLATFLLVVLVAPVASNGQAQDRRTPSGQRASPAAPTSFELIDQGLKAGRINEESNGLPSLAGLYKHFKFDRTVRWVAFTNTIGGTVFPHFSVWGIEKIRGSWKQPVDWTKKLDLDWCRDQATQDLEELVIILETAIGKRGVT